MHHTEPTSKLAHLAQSLPGWPEVLHHGRPAGGHQPGLAALVHHLEDLVPPGVVLGSFHFHSTLLCSGTVHLKYETKQTESPLFVDSVFSSISPPCLELWFFFRAENFLTFLRKWAIYYKASPENFCSKRVLNHRAQKKVCFSANFALLAGLFWYRCSVERCFASRI